MGGTGGGGDVCAAWKREDLCEEEDFGERVNRFQNERCVSSSSPMDVSAF